jgi:iron complex transport system substrate-binding protein
MRPTRRALLAAAAAAWATESRGAPPQRVAALDWALTETMLALGRTPVAVVAASDWSRWVIEPPLPAGVADLGVQPEINFELLAWLRPDLILTSPFVQTLEPALSRIAPVSRHSIFEPTDTPLSQPRKLALELGEQLGASAEARRFVDVCESRLQTLQRRVQALAPRPLLLGTFIDARHVRVYGGAGLFQNVLDRLGIANGWSGRTGYWGFAMVGVERLATAADVQFIAIEPVPPDTWASLRSSPLWRQLPFVAAGRVSTLPPVLMFGALPAAMRFANLLVDHLERLPR